MIECETCYGEGVVEHPHLQGAYVSSHAESPHDPVFVECEDCGGTGWLKCDWCGCFPPSVRNLDGDNLCEPCSLNWLKGEETFARESEQRDFVWSGASTTPFAADRGESGE